MITAKTKHTREVVMKNIVSVIALFLVIIGAINWLLIGIFSFDLVSFVLGPMTIVTRIIYGLVGLAGLWLIGAAVVNATRGNRIGRE